MSENQTTPASPYNAACPRCGGQAGYNCRTATGYRAAPHRERWRAVGIARPGPEDAHAAFLDLRMREIRRISAAHPGGRAA